MAQAEYITQVCNFMRKIGVYDLILMDTVYMVLCGADAA